MPAVISLTTDFGLDDPFVGLVKAQLLCRCPEARLVDLTHGVAAQRVEEGAFWLERSWRYFPEGTVHVAIVDPGVGSARGVLAVRTGGHLFLGPDNGLLGGVAATPGATVRRVRAELPARLGLTAPSATFHGRDVFAPLAGELAAGRLAYETLGPAVNDWVVLPGSGPDKGPQGWRGRVIVIDRFGNCFSNIEEISIVKSEIVDIRFGEHLLPLVRTYADRPQGTPVALFNSFGVLEAACVQGRADRALGLVHGSPVAVSCRPRAIPPRAR